MFRELFESMQTWKGTLELFRGGGSPRYYTSKDGSYGTWGEGMYFSLDRSEAEAYGNVKEYTFKGTLLDTEGDDYLTKNKIKKIEQDLGVEITPNRFWLQVQEILQKTEKSKKDTFDIISKHSKIDGFIGAGHEVILFNTDKVK